MLHLEPTTLVGKHAILEPLSQRHHDALIEALQDGQLWKLWYTSIPEPSGLKAEIDRRLLLQSQGMMLPFTVLDAATNNVSGMTSYMNIDSPNRRVEIGGTWYRKSLQRTALNTDCKWLLLSHAFEKLDCIGVELRTHFFNHTSRKAIERLGAKLDGIMRSNQIARNGTLRDTCVYSILAGEWPTVKAHLQFKLNR